MNPITEVSWSGCLTPFCFP